MASQAEIFGAAAGAVKDGFLARLIDRYRVLLVDYPSIGRSRDILTDELTADRVCSDLLSVANAAGFDRFVYWAYSWGAAVGLQLVSRTDRLTALVAGGWPPLGAQYKEALRASLEQIDDPPEAVQVVLRSPAQYAQWSTFYGSVQDWPEEHFARRISCPRLAFAGAEGDTEAGSEKIMNATILRERKTELERFGWDVKLIEGQGHDVCMKPEVLVPVVREFLDREFR
jgi:pimeloyl-ACP methyl ester carboxylesterase